MIAGILFFSPELFFVFVLQAIINDSNSIAGSDIFFTDTGTFIQPGHMPVLSS